ncbi:uncharacterized protein LOC108090773 [Drosophila ficusphila]|uniref:uncharacterized protein LOC108090773 n=1 Tax=Drosophila ficusphila TaxID=30025 RepID=UPI0007E6F00E|nr:uncharacterized protein LOC108090773 [Drosophila ficusphila]
MDFLDPELHSFEEVRAQFEEYKKQHQLEQQELHKRLESKFNLDGDLKKLNSAMETLRAGMQKLELEQQSQLCNKELATSDEAIESAPAGQADSSAQDCCTKLSQLVIKSGVSKCLFENCQRRVDNQLLLLHYLCDHDHKDASFQRCQPLVEGERAVLSFRPQGCEFRVNQVLGLLAYSGLPEQRSPASLRRGEVCNSVLPQDHFHLEAHVPVVVLICRTAAPAALRNTALPRRGLPSDQVYVLWLVTPSERLQLSATLSLSGRDAAVRAKCVVGVRQVSSSQDTDCFMAIDENYWPLSHAEVTKLSNNFRDELHLEVSLADPGSTGTALTAFNLHLRCPAEPCT